MSLVGDPARDILYVAYSGGLCGIGAFVLSTGGVKFVVAPDSAVIGGQRQYLYVTELNRVRRILAVSDANAFDEPQRITLADADTSAVDEPQRIVDTSAFDQP